MDWEEFKKMIEQMDIEPIIYIDSEIYLGSMDWVKGEGRFYSKRVTTVIFNGTFKFITRKMVWEEFVKFMNLSSLKKVNMIDVESDMFLLNYVALVEFTYKGHTNQKLCEPINTEIPQYIMLKD